MMEIHAVIMNIFLITCISMSLVLVLLLSFEGFVVFSIEKAIVNKIREDLRFKGKDLNFYQKFNYRPFYEPITILDKNGFFRNLTGKRKRTFHILTVLTQRRFTSLDQFITIYPKTQIMQDIESEILNKLLETEYHRFWIKSPSNNRRWIKVKSFSASN